MNARSALFDVYGDHLRSRGGSAPVAALVALLAPLGIAAPAVRTAVSRMVKQGWLEPVPMQTGPGYALTPRAEHRLAEAADRIYRARPDTWDGRWHLVVLGRIADRAGRQRVRNAMSYLGYASLREETWISPRSSDELEALLDSEGVGAQRFYARSEQEGEDALLAAQAWDLEGLRRDYTAWLESAHRLVSTAPLDPVHDRKEGDREAFVVRSRLVHEWRKFLFRDPGLPGDLLPAGWAGNDAARYFDVEASRLLPAASRFVDGCLA